MNIDLARDRRGSSIPNMRKHAASLPPRIDAFYSRCSGSQPQSRVGGTLKEQPPLIDRLRPMQVSVPMELFLTVRKAGSAGKGEASEGHWQQLSKVVREAHRPVVFEVDDLVSDTR